MATRHSSGSARDRRRAGGNLPRTHPSGRGSARASANGGLRSSAPAPKQNKTSGISERTRAGTPASRKRQTDEGGNQHASAHRDANSEHNLPHWETFDDIQNKPLQAVDVCTVVVGYLMGPSGGSGRDACTTTLDNCVVEVVRKQAARLSRIYTGKDART